jgi:hypothetical protein
MPLLFDRLLEKIGYYCDYKGKTGTRQRNLTAAVIFSLIIVYGYQH